MPREEALRLLGHVESLVKIARCLYDPSRDDDELQHKHNTRYRDVLEQYNEACEFVASLP